LTEKPTLILASSSPFRKALMLNAGLEFEAFAANVDERAISQPMEETGADPADIAVTLAIAKAREVGHHHPDAYIIGSDQTLSLGQHSYHKPKDRAEAAGHLNSFSGKTHYLNSAIAITRGGEIVWTHVAKAAMKVRDLSEREIENYLDRVGSKVFLSVGAYQIEGLGIHLFEKIEGDYFTIMGLPMLPLLAALRDLGINHE
jgi:septum formation protein